MIIVNVLKEIIIRQSAAKPLNVRFGMGKVHRIGGDLVQKIILPRKRNVEIRRYMQDYMVTYRNTDKKLYDNKIAS